jgi:hypothetical protein
MTFNPSSVNNSMIAALTKAVNHFVIKMKDRIEQNGLPKAISNATTVEPAKSLGMGLMSIDVVIDLEKAPMAAAFEWGSGLYGEKKEKYEISPKEGNDHLAFPISRWPNYEPPPNVTFARFPGPISNKNFVLHPGVKAKPYIIPTLQAEKDEIIRILGQEFIDAVFVGAINAMKYKGGS